MFVILEGTDATGKSSLAIDLANAMQGLGHTVESLHRGVPERDVLDEYQLDVEDYRSGGTRSIVADRWHWGDLVYGPLYRGNTYLGAAGFRYVELFLRSRGAVTLLVENSPQVILERFATRGEDYLKPEHVERVLQDYGQVYEHSVTAVERITPDGDNAELVEKIIKHAQFWDTLTADLAPFPTYIGDRTPAVLLLGEKRGNPDTAQSMTAFRPVGGNSAQFLLSALPDPMWKSVGLANLFEEPDIDALIDVLAGPNIIALGRKVSDELSKRGIEHSSVPHPQAIRRFHSGMKLAYGQLIKETMNKSGDNISWPKSSNYEI